MIGECHSGAGFGGLTRYLLHGKKDNPNPERVLWTSTRELALEDPQQAAILMRMTAAQGRTQEPVEHISISIPPHEHLSREQWERVAQREPPPSLRPEESIGISAPPGQLAPWHRRPFRPLPSARLYPIGNAEALSPFFSQARLEPGEPESPECPAAAADGAPGRQCPPWK